MVYQKKHKQFFARNLACGPESDVENNVTYFLIDRYVVKYFFMNHSTCIFVLTK